MADTIRAAGDFLADVQDQVKKVTWPDRAQLQNSTIVIIVFVVIVALVIFGMDFVVSAAMAVLRSLLGG
jgi:preprotein translocase subunit SecE